MKGLTLKQAQALEFIITSTRDKGYPPSVRDIAERFDITVKASFDRLQALRRKGFIEIGDKKSRAIRVIRRNEC